MRITKIFLHRVVLLSALLAPIAQGQSTIVPAVPTQPCFLGGGWHCDEYPMPSEFELFAGFLVLYLDVLGLIALALPRTWFVWCFRTLFPFMPERIEEDDNG